MGACKDDDEGVEHFSTMVDVSASSLAEHKYDIITVFSTDGGTTFVEYPNIAPGQTYMVKAVDGDVDITGTNCFAVDWSSSSPQPKSVSAGVATFVMGSKNDLIAVATNIPVVAAEMEGTYEVVTDEWVDFHAGDELTVEAIDATHIRIVEYPNTGVDHAALVITIDDFSTGASTVEEQYNGAYSDPDDDGTTTTGTGTVSSCGGTIDLVLNFNVAGDDYNDNALVLKRK